MRRCMAAANTLITEGQQGLHDRHGTSSLADGSMHWLAKIGVYVSL